MRWYKLLAMLVIILLLFSGNTVAAPNEPKLTEMQPVAYAQAAEVEFIRDFESSFTSKKVEQPKASGQATQQSVTGTLTATITHYCAKCKDKKKLNMLGKLLMKVRKEIRDEQEKETIGI